MPKAGDMYVVEIGEAHINWGEHRNPTNRAMISGESYVKIPSDAARRFGLVRGTTYMAHFTNGFDSFPIKAAGNGPFEDGIQYAKQFEGIGAGACKEFTPWYESCNAEAGNKVRVEFLSSVDVQFTII